MFIRDVYYADVCGALFLMSIDSFCYMKDTIPLFPRGGHYKYDSDNRIKDRQS